MNINCTIMAVSMITAVYGSAYFAAGASTPLALPDSSHASVGAIGGIAMGVAIKLEW